MKTLTSLIALTLFSLAGFSQKIDPESVAKLPQDQQELVNSYLKQAKNAKTTALVLCIAGGALAFAGAAVTMWDEENLGEYVTNNGSMSGTATALIVTGAASALASIPFFIKTHKKRDQARAIVFADKGTSMAPNIMLPHTQSFGVKVMIPLGK